MDGVPDIDQIISASLDAERKLCPACGMGWVVPGTAAADKHGVCPACYSRALADATRQRRRDEDARREYDAARSELRRERRRHGKAPKDSKPGA